MEIVKCFALLFVGAIVRQRREIVGTLVQVCTYVYLYNCIQ